MSDMLEKGKLYRVVGKCAWAEYGSIVRSLKTTPEHYWDVGRCKILFGKPTPDSTLGLNSSEVYLLPSEVEDYTP